MPFNPKDEHDLAVLSISLSDLEMVYRYRGTINPVVIEMSRRLVKGYYDAQALMDAAEDAAGFQRRINELEHELSKEEIEHVATKKELESYRRVYG